MQEFGLNYESDPAISRHLANFLRRSRQNVESKAQLTELVKDRLARAGAQLLPNVVLFNGGVFKTPRLRQRVLNLLTEWNGGEAVRELEGAGLDIAVAQGAAYYGQLRATGQGIRVQSGTARSYYIGLESAMPAVPGIKMPIKGLCLVPQGTDEGTEVELESQQFGVVVGEPVEFQFFSSAVRAGDALGDLVEDAERDLDEGARLSLTLPADGEDEGDVIPVHLDAIVSELGTLQVSMKDISGGRKWNLEFDIRAHEHH
jgi:hypothetical protein